MASSAGTVAVLLAVLLSSLAGRLAVAQLTPCSDCPTICSKQCPGGVEQAPGSPHPCSSSCSSSCVQSCVATTVGMCTDYSCWWGYCDSYCRAEADKCNGYCSSACRSCQANNAQYCYNTSKGNCNQHCA